MQHPLQGKAGERAPVCEGEGRQAEKSRLTDLRGPRSLIGMMSPSFGEWVGIFSFLASLGAVGTALWMFDEQHRRSRIDNFVTRYIALLPPNMNLCLEDYGYRTMINAGVLWLESSEEVRASVRKIKDCGVYQPFNEQEIQDDLLLFFRMATDAGESLNDFESIVRAKATFATATQPPSRSV